MNEDAEFQVDRVVPRSVEPPRSAELAATTRELAPTARISFAEATRYLVCRSAFSLEPGNCLINLITEGSYIAFQLGYRTFSSSVLSTSEQEF